MKIQDGGADVQKRNGLLKFKIELTSNSKRLSENRGLRYIPKTSVRKVSSVKFFHSLPHYGNDIAWHFEVVKSQGRSDGFANVL